MIALLLAAAMAATAPGPRLTREEFNQTLNDMPGLASQNYVFDNVSTVIDHLDQSLDSIKANALTSCFDVNATKLSLQELKEVYSSKYIYLVNRALIKKLGTSKYQLSDVELKYTSSYIQTESRSLISSQETCKSIMESHG